MIKLDGVTLHCKVSTAAKPYLTLIWVEVMCFLWLVIRDTFQRGPVVPVSAVIVAQDAEDPVSLYCPVTTDHQSPFRWLKAFL